MATDPELVVRTYWSEVWLDRDLDAVDRFMTDPVVRHTGDGTQRLSREQLKDHLAGALSALRPTAITFDALTVDGDTVWARITLHAVSLATAAPMPVTNLAQYRLEDGRIAESWQLHQSGIDWNET
jgi:ketosteroid isomerase-like protein